MRNPWGRGVIALTIVALVLVAVIGLPRPALKLRDEYPSNSGDRWREALYAAALAANIG